MQGVFVNSIGNIFQSRKCAFGFGQGGGTGGVYYPLGGGLAQQVVHIAAGHGLLAYIQQHRHRKRRHAVQYLVHDAALDSLQPLGQPAHIQQAAMLGACDYLTRPLRLDDLRSAIRLAAAPPRGS